MTKLDFESSKRQKATFSPILWLTQELLLHAISFNRVQHKLCCRICANHPESGWLAEKFAQNHPVENWIVRNVLRHKKEEHLLEGLLEKKNGTMQNNLKKQTAYVHADPQMRIRLQLFYIRLRSRFLTEIKPFAFDSWDANSSSEGNNSLVDEFIN